MKTLFSLTICLITFNMSYSQCYVNRHSTRLQDVWISCNKTSNPNSERENSHWIQYDFAEVHILGPSRIWNINTPEYTDLGAKDMIIDYSIDGTIWHEWGMYHLAEANTSGFYQGEDGPDFKGLKARYVLITIADNYGNNCAGIAELRIESLGIPTSIENIDVSNNNLQVHPNPALDFTIVEFESIKSTQVVIKLINMKGEELLVQYHTISTGTNSIRLELEDIASGNYVVLIETDSSQFSSQLSIINK